MRSLFASAELFPYSKTGGLGDIAAALSGALEKFVTIERITPYYRFMSTEAKEYDRFSVTLDRDYEIRLLRRDGTIFVYNELLSEVDRPYGYQNDWLRFAIFSKVIARLSRRFDLLHLHDWHTALAALWSDTKKIFTLHNLAYQGIFDAQILQKLHLEPFFNMDGIEFYGKVNFLKGGIAYSDHITTVSPTYAREILHPQFGCGLEGFLKKHRHRLTGILNGIDYRIYDPANDPLIPYHYDRLRIRFKEANKKIFFASRRPLFIFIGRFVEQKGIDLIVKHLDALAKRPLLLYILGEGEERFKEAIQKQTHGNIRFFFGYEETLSHQLYGAADFLLMPSRFEPCGLNQMIAMRYGAMPIVRPVGGLRDTVHPLGSQKCGQGLLLHESGRFLETIDQAIELYETDRYRQGTVQNMECDFSIEQCAKEYYELYKRL